jgi:hypothetical protein
VRFKRFKRFVRFTEFVKWFFLLAAAVFPLARRGWRDEHKAKVLR